MTTAHNALANDLTPKSAPAILEQLVQQAEHAGASDIHLQSRGKSAEVSFRLDGVITAGAELPAEVAERVFGRIKFLAAPIRNASAYPIEGREHVLILPINVGEGKAPKNYSGFVTKPLGIYAELQVRQG